MKVAGNNVGDKILMTGKEVREYVDKLLETHETRWKRREQGGGSRELEQAVSRVGV